MQWLIIRKKGLIDPWKGRKDLVQKSPAVRRKPQFEISRGCLSDSARDAFCRCIWLSCGKETARAAISCRDGLKQISKERIQTELCRFFDRKRHRKSFVCFLPVFAVILPECGEEAEDWKKLSGCLERASTDLVIRIAVLLSQSTDVPAVLSPIAVA